MTPPPTPDRSPLVAQMSKYSLYQLDQFSNNQRDLIVWLGREGFLAINRSCPTCHQQLRLLKDSRRAVDGYSLRCSSCKFSMSVRSDSLFDVFHMSLLDAMRLLVLFVNKSAAAHAAKITDIGRDTVSRFFGVLRELMAVDLEYDPVRFYADEVVEIDESLVAALRDDETQRGRTTGWVFGIVSRDTGAVHLEEVPNREGKTLLGVMKKHVERGAIVCGDDWRGYSALQDDYVVRTITKGSGAMSYWDNNLHINVHTGTIEGVWSQLRAMLHVSRGFPRHYVPLVLAEFIYRKSRRDIYSLAKI